MFAGRLDLSGPGAERSSVTQRVLDGEVPWLGVDPDAP